MEVAACRASGVTTEPQHLAAEHPFVFVHQRSAQMAIDGLESVVMTHHHIVAVAAGVPTYDTHLAVPCRTYRVAYLHLEVCASVHAIATPTVLAGDVSGRREGEPSHRDTHVVLQAVEEVAVGVDSLIRPDETIGAIRRVMVHQRGVAEHELRRQFVDEVTVVGMHHQFAGQCLLVAVNEERVAHEMAGEPFGHANRRYVQFVQLAQFIPYSFGQRGVNRQFGHLRQRRLLSRCRRVAAHT